jgi:pimeloyl-CoA synthetase
MTFEKPKPIPEKNELPLKIAESKAFPHQGRDSSLTNIKIEKGDASMALKEVRKEEFASLEEMKKSREFYDYLKKMPGLGKFVLDTSFFQARKTAEENPHAYRIQKIVEGKRLDELRDKDLYSDPELSKQLLDFVNSAIEALKKANESKEGSPDFYGDKLASIYLYNPRYSGNIMIADKPDEMGRRIFLVDTSKQVQQTSKIGSLYQKHIGSQLQIAQLERWKKKIEERLAK